jgi:metal-responsive CopG/Arc/MetJ family transcriptional regulator
MAVRKIAISLPEDVLRQVDRQAKRSKTTRSGWITSVLSEVSRASTRAEITERINGIFGVPELAEEQSATATEYLKAAESGSEDEGW